MVMEKLKVDRTKLKTVNNYAKAYGISKPTVYKRIETGEIKKVVIDGVTFVHI